MISFSSFIASFRSRVLSILAFFLDFANDFFVTLANAKTSFLLLGGEDGLGECWGVYGGSAK